MFNIFIDPLLFLQAIREMAGGFFNEFFMTCTLFGEITTTIIIISIIYWAMDKKLGEYLFISFAGANLVATFAKTFACINRPWILDSRVHPVNDALPSAKGYSFTSGHTTNGTVIFAGTALRGKLPKFLSATLIISLLLLGFSRCYLGVHSVLDVSFAIIFTIIVLLFFNRIFDKLEENPNLDIIISCIGIFLTILVAIYTVTKSYPMDYDAAGNLIVDPAKSILYSLRFLGLNAGIFAAWPIERRFVKFSNDIPFEGRLTRAVIGYIIITLYFTLIEPLFGQTQIEFFFSQFILAIIIIVIYPAIFKFFENRK